MNIAVASLAVLALLAAAFMVEHARRCPATDDVGWRCDRRRGHDGHHRIDRGPHRYDFYEPGGKPLT